MRNERKVRNVRNVRLDRGLELLLPVLQILQRASAESAESRVSNGKRSKGEAWTRNEHMTHPGPNRKAQLGQMASTKCAITQVITKLELAAPSVCTKV